VAPAISLRSSALIAQWRGSCRHDRERRCLPAVTVWFVVRVDRRRYRAGLTVSVAALLVTVPAVFVTTTRNVDLVSESSSPCRVAHRRGSGDVRSVLLPLIAQRAVPAAHAANVAVCPAVTVWFAGGVVIVGATGPGLTVSVAAVLVTVPAVFVTTTANVDPLRKSSSLVR